MSMLKFLCAAASFGLRGIIRGCLLRILSKCSNNLAFSRQNLERRLLSSTVRCLLRYSSLNILDTSGYLIVTDFRSSIRTQVLSEILFLLTYMARINANLCQYETMKSLYIPFKKINL